MYYIKRIFPFFILILFVGCSGGRFSGRTITKPELLRQTTMPALPPGIKAKDLTLNTIILVDNHGDVADVILSNTSGNKDWDSRAIDSIKKWKYTPTFVDGEPVRAWIRQTVYVNVGDPVYMSLAMFRFFNRVNADSAYSQLINGEKPSTVLGKYSPQYQDITNWLIGRIDINSYPQKVNEALSKLKVYEYTKPISYGGRIVIFRRLPSPDNI